MSKSYTISTSYLNKQIQFLRKLSPLQWVFFLSLFFAVAASTWSLLNGYSAIYGDAESHLNIAKRVAQSLTPGFAQLGGIWLPLPHILLIPFVSVDILWRTGAAGAIVSGIAYIISSIYIYKLTRLLTSNTKASFFAALIFMLNPNMLYLQSTPMTELTLIVFFILSSYYFIKFLKDDSNLLYLILAAFFGFCASLSRYDGWALVLMEAGVLVLHYILPVYVKDWFNPMNIVRGIKKKWDTMEGSVILFSSMAFFGIALWLFWDFLILGDPLYFTHSQFSANSQQNSWLLKGQLPSYHDLWLSFLYYYVTAVTSGGLLISIAAIVGILIYLFLSQDKTQPNSVRLFVLLVLLVPFFFNVVTLFLGQSVIFIPSLTPISFEWTLFNVRYGAMMVPVVAVFFGYLYYILRPAAKNLLILLALFQCGLFFIGYSPVLSFDDGYKGLSSGTANIPDAQGWLAREYDHGLVLTDDFARTISIIRTPIPMTNIIYIGNKPYWEESLKEPEKYARWIVMQENDAVWTNIWENPETQARLFKYFNKVYTSKEIVIFRRIDNN